MTQSGYEERMSDEEKAARGAEAVTASRGAIEETVRAQYAQVPVEKRKHFDVVRWVAVKKEHAKQRIAESIDRSIHPRAALVQDAKGAVENAAIVGKNEFKAIKWKILTKTVGILATVGAAIDPEPITKAALAATAAALNLGEHAIEPAALIKSFHDIREKNKQKKLAKETAKAEMANVILRKPRFGFKPAG